MCVCVCVCVCVCCVIVCVLCDCFCVHSSHLCSSVFSYINQMESCRGTQRALCLRFVCVFLGCVQVGCVCVCVSGTISQITRSLCADCSI